MSRELRFPEGFFWGAGTSSHQVEGGNKNDWTVWEKENAGRLAEEAKHHWYFWQLELFPEIVDPKNYISGKAVDHYNRYEEDFDIAKSLGHNAHRFSIEWSRIEPKEGKFDKDEIEHYRKVIAALKRRGIEPFVTLWHWSLPLWLRDKGGWEHHKTPHYFSRYAVKMIDELGKDAHYWITLNEPVFYVFDSYLRGVRPPQKKNIFTYFKVMHNLARGHKLSANAIQIISSSARVGVAKDNIYLEAYKNRFVNRLLKRVVDWWWNFYFLNNVRKHIDFIGLNNYFHNRINYGFNRNDKENVSDLGWEIYPEAIYYTLQDLKRYKKPIFITENGLADAGDNKRAKYMREVLWNVYRAIRGGVDVRGYFYWSLLDNFEWDKGFWPRFGLVEIDYESDLKRTVRGSAKEYAKIIKANAIVESD